MRNILLTLLCASALLGCAKDAAHNTGDIYGIVTVKATAEPMRATGVELFVLEEDDYSYDIVEKLLLRTVTYDDGHYEFNELAPGDYRIKITAEGYVDIQYDVIVEAGRTANADMQLEKVSTGMVVQTLAATDITSNSVILNGKYSYEYRREPNECGFFYATTSNPANGGNRVTGKVDGYKFSATVSNIKKGVYYVQAYSKNSYGTELGEQQSFEISGNPSVETLDATNVSVKNATLNGKITFFGDPACTQKGFVYSTSYTNPTVDDPKDKTTKVAVSGMSSDFSVNIDLPVEGTYYFRTFVINSSGVFYGDTQSFDIKKTPTLETLPATNISINNATLNGKITFPGDPAYTQKGFVYSHTFSNPTIDDPESTTTKVMVSGTSYEFSANVTLSEEGAYYVRAFIVNSSGVFYGDAIKFSNIPYIYVGKIAVQLEDIGSGYWSMSKSMCENSNVGGFNDWRLPTIDELGTIYAKRDIIGGFRENDYWSSSYYTYGTSVYRYFIDFSSGGTFHTSNSYNYYARCVRTVTQ